MKVATFEPHRIHLMSFNEFIVEDAALAWFGELDYVIGYRLPLAPGEPGAAILKLEEMFDAGSEQSEGSSAHLEPSSAHLPIIPNGEPEQRDADGCLLTGQLDAPVIDSLEGLKPAFRADLEKLAAEPRAKGKISQEAMRQTILTICKGHYVALSSLAELVNRDPDALRQQHLKPLTKEGKLRLAFPTAPTHAKQAYRAAE